MKPAAKSASHTPKQVEGDQHRLLGQILDNRLRVISLNHISPRQWLYQVEPPSVGKTRRALKVLGDPLSREPGAFYRLKTSYQRLKQINSPYVERSYECGLLHDLTPYIVVEWEPFQSLYEYLRLKRKPLTWLEARPLFFGIASGLKALHDQGLAHGDLRPQHVLLRNPPNHPVLIDACINSSFGSPPVPGLERSSAFWAPERRGLSAATPSSDLYSFGALMFYCLTGTPPFTVGTSGFLEQESAQLQSPIRCIELAHDEKAPSWTVEDVPNQVKDLIFLLLSKSVRERPTLSETLKLIEPSGEDQSLASTIGMGSNALQTEIASIINELSPAPSPHHSSLESSPPDQIIKENPSKIVGRTSPWLVSALCSIAAILGLMVAKL